MASINYEDLLSRLMMKIEPFDWLDLSEEEINEFFVGWLHSTVSNPIVRRLFSSLTLDDDVEEVAFEINDSVDELYDTDFITEVIVLGIGYQWLTPKINSLGHIVQRFGSSDEKYYSQAQHLSELRGLKKDWIKEQAALINNRGYSWNSYLGSGQ